LPTLSTCLECSARDFAPPLANFSVSELAERTLETYCPIEARRVTVTERSATGHLRVYV